MISKRYAGTRVISEPSFEFAKQSRYFEIDNKKKNIWRIYDGSFEDSITIIEYVHVNQGGVLLQ